MSSPDRTTQILTTLARPVGPSRIARIRYFCPYCVDSRDSASATRCCARRSASKTSQCDAEYPSLSKKRALNRPITWLVDSRYPCSFVGSMTAWSALGSFTALVCALAIQLRHEIPSFRSLLCTPNVRFQRRRLSLPCRRPLQTIVSQLAYRSGSSARIQLVRYTAAVSNASSGVP